MMTFLVSPTIFETQSPGVNAPGAFLSDQLSAKTTFIKIFAEVSNI